jgi:hypothetical protein
MFRDFKFPVKSQEISKTKTEGKRMDIPNNFNFFKFLIEKFYSILCCYYYYYYYYYFMIIGRLGNRIHLIDCGKGVGGTRYRGFSLFIFFMFIF